MASRVTGVGRKRARTAKAVPAAPGLAVRKKQGRRAGPTLGRTAILRAVCRLLRTRSYSQVTLALVARELKVDPALIRYYFRDHGTLMLLAGQVMREEFVSVMKASLERSDGSPEGLLRARVAGLMEVGLRYPFLLRLLVDITYLNPHPEARSTLRKLTESSVAFYKGIVDAGVAAGEFRPVEPMFLTMAALGMVDAFTIQEPLFRASRQLGAPKKVLRQRYESFMADLLVNALKAPKVE